VRTPTEASDILKRGRPMAGMAWVNMLSNAADQLDLLLERELGQQARALASMAGESGAGAWAAVGIVVVIAQTNKTRTRHGMRCQISDRVLCTVGLFIGREPQGLVPCDGRFVRDLPRRRQLSGRHRYADSGTAAERSN
jgi:hypothetical protein